MSSAFERLQKKAIEKKAKLELVPAAETKPTPPTVATAPTLPTNNTERTPPTPRKIAAISPEKDYTKIPNSIRRADEQGLFIGKSKKLYDALYHQTRGKKYAPTVSAKLKKKNLMTWSGIASERTFLKNLDFLKSLGLVKVAICDGKHEGNEYTVFIPEEIESFSTVPTPRTAPDTQHPPPKVGTLPPVESGVGSVGLNDENKTTSGGLKTLFKDIENIDDDSPLHEALSILNAAAKRATGKGLNRTDLKSFSEFVKVFVNETDLAAARASSVSSYIALGTENLKRRLYPKAAKGKSKKPFEPGKAEIAEISPEPVEPLEDDIKQTVLESLRQMVKSNGRESVEFFKGNYTPEDWNWLMDELRK